MFPPLECFVNGRSPPTLEKRLHRTRCASVDAKYANPTVLPANCNSMTVKLRPRKRRVTSPNSPCHPEPPTPNRFQTPQTTPHTPHPCPIRHARARRPLRPCVPGLAAGIVRIRIGVTQLGAISCLDHLYHRRNFMLNCVTPIRIFKDLGIIRIGTVPQWRSPNPGKS